MSRHWLELRLAAPMMSFGGVAVDHVGPTMRMPGQAMLTGLIGNALGWDWQDREAHASLQHRLVHATAILRPGEIMTDVQNVQLARNDIGWTTRGAPEGRTGASYAAPHRRQRDFICDAELAVVLTLASADREPTLDTVRRALARPARPLFIGRKSCLPARPVLCKSDAPLIEAENAYLALRQILDGTEREAMWPYGEGPSGTRLQIVADLRNWDSGLHGGTRRVWEGRA